MKLELCNFQSKVHGGRVALSCQSAATAARFHVWVNHEGFPCDDVVYKNHHDHPAVTRYLNRNRGQGKEIAHELLTRAGELIEVAKHAEEKRLQEYELRRKAEILLRRKTEAAEILFDALKLLLQTNFSLTAAHNAESIIEDIERPIK